LPLVEADLRAAGAQAPDHFIYIAGTGLKKIEVITVAGFLSYLLLQAGRGKLFPDFKNPIIIFVLFAVMAVLIVYAYISREK